MINFYIFIVISPMKEHLIIEEPDIIDNEITQERPDGSSDWLLEKMDIDLGNWYKECSNWNPDLHKLWTLEAISPEVKESTAEQLVEAFNQAKQELFPGKTKLTPKEELEVYKRMKKD